MNFAAGRLARLGGKQEANPMTNFAVRRVVCVCVWWGRRTDGRLSLMLSAHNLFDFQVLNCLSIYGNFTFFPFIFAKRSKKWSQVICFSLAFYNHFSSPVRASDFMMEVTNLRDYSCFRFHLALIFPIKIEWKKCVIVRAWRVQSNYRGRLRTLLPLRSLTYSSYLGETLCFSVFALGS